MSLLWDKLSLPLWFLILTVTLLFPSLPCFKIVVPVNLQRLFASYKRYYFISVFIFNLVLLFHFLHTSHGYDVNSIVLGTIQTLAYALRKIDNVLVTGMKLIVFYCIWKLKDRIMAAFGVENAGALIGDYRDWLTCWGMYRFQPLEIYLWKVEGLDVGENLFLEVKMGYNFGHRTRVRQRASESSDSTTRGSVNSRDTINNTVGNYRLDVKESLQINWDTHDLSEIMTIEVRQQGIYTSDLISRCQIGCGTLNSMIGKEKQNTEMNPVTSTHFQYQKTGSISHNTTQLMFESGETDHCWQKVNLIPHGVLWFRVIPFRETVAGQDEV